MPMKLPSPPHHSTPHGAVLAALALVAALAFAPPTFAQPASPDARAATGSAAPSAASAAASAPASAAAGAASATAPATANAGQPAEFAACLANLRGEAASRGISGANFDALTSALDPDKSVLASLDAQPEFVTPIWDYLATLVDEERVADGREMLERWRKVLAKVEDEYGVDPATVVAVWGVESNFGRNFGTKPLLRSLSTLSCYGRRQTYFRGEFLTALEIVQNGDIAADRLTGSWAGAFGHTQFMPSTFKRLAVDFDGDGRRDLVDSEPDALASTANFLRKAGWRTEIPWGFEVKLPKGFDTGDAGRRNKQPMSAWASRGIVRVDGSPLPDGATPVGLLLPAGAQGPAFLVTKNFDALFSYNAAESYALAIAHLADRLRGGGPFVTPWPTDDPGLSRAERRELQELLIARGHDIGEVDGFIGKRTRDALKLVLAELDVPYEEGRVGQKALRALRAARGGGGSGGAEPR